MIGIAGQQCIGTVVGGMISHDQLEIVVVLREDRIERLREILDVPVGRHDDRDTWVHSFFSAVGGSGRRRNEKCLWPT
ncbi:hypothetical protein D3C72_1921820 [compost metagenome]